MAPRAIISYLSPRAMVSLPVIVLTAIFAVILAFGFLLPTSGSTSTVVLVLGLCAYATAVTCMVRLGAAQLARLERLALTDSLCGLPNRRALHLETVRIVHREPEIAMALIDLDGFKGVNDFYGHTVGDRVIRDCADLLKELCEGQGKAYRLGGDEFALVVAGPIAGTILEGLCRHLLKRFEEPLKIDDRSIVLGASIGLSHSTNLGLSTSSVLLRQADVAMYVSKARGKMRITWFDAEFDRKRDAQQRIDTDLRLALAEGHLYLHYQPLVDAITGRVTAVEALIRWERPDGERIGPDKFIPVAEETGLIDAIGLWVLRQACSDALGWDGVRLSVNVSAAQLRNPDFPVQLGQILEETGFPASRLELEITETYLVGDPTVAGRNLDMLREFGVGIVLDDYGTGYASIGFLRRFRFEKLKLDRSLIVDASSDDATRAVMASSVAIAKALGMKVTAEGVETEIQATLARTAGCDQMQGWLYSKAIPADEIALWLEAQEDEMSAINTSQQTRGRVNQARARGK